MGPYYRGHSTWLMVRIISQLHKTVRSCDRNECPDGTPDREFERNEMRNIKIAACRVIIVGLHRKLRQHKYVFVMKMVSLLSPPECYAGNKYQR